MNVFQFLQTKNMQNMTGLPCGHHTRASDRIASDIFTRCRILIYSLPGSNCFSFYFRNFVTVPLLNSVSSGHYLLQCFGGRHWPRHVLRCRNESRLIGAYRDPEKLQD